MKTPASARSRRLIVASLYALGCLIAGLVGAVAFAVSQDLTFGQLLPSLEVGSIIGAILALVALVVARRLRDSGRRLRWGLGSTIVFGGIVVTLVRAFAPMAVPTLMTASFTFFVVILPLGALLEEEPKDH